jgi:hypothetical protein
VAGATWVADSPQTSQRLLKRVLSHFDYGESLAIRTRIRCVVGGRSDSPKEAATAMLQSGPSGWLPAHEPVPVHCSFQETPFIPSRYAVKQVALPLSRVAQGCFAICD